jgi:cellulose 1,4-beta-cellobiosidase
LKKPFSCDILDVKEKAILKGNLLSEIETMGARIRIFVGVLICSGLVLYNARADELCTDANDKWKAIDIMSGQYRISNNVWRGTTQQCLTVYPDSTYFSVIRSTHDLNNVAAYPCIIKGRHFGGDNTQNSGLPILVSDIATAPVAWSVDVNGAGGVWNSAYESWFSKTGGTVPDAAELMIWINSKGGMKPRGTKVATVSIAGASWDVYYDTRSDWNYIAYKKVQPAPKITFDLKDFIDDAISRGYIKTSWYLDSMEAGFEIMRDGQGLTNNSFSAAVTGRNGTKTN